MTTEIKRLYRSRSERIIAGVCGGLGQYINVDPTLIRLIFIVLALLGGPGIIVYLIMWLIVPEEPLAKDTVITATAEPAPSEKPEE